MATLPASDRQGVWRGLMRFWSALREPVSGVTKADLQAAVDATDNWIDSNAASYNAALPVAARTGLTLSQKTLLFCAVALMRVSKAAATKFLGDLD